MLVTVSAFVLHFVERYKVLSTRGQSENPKIRYETHIWSKDTVRLFEHIYICKFKKGQLFLGKDFDCPENLDYIIS